MNVGDFEELEARLGWNPNPRSAMSYPRLRSLMDPASTPMYDWMHCIFVGGVFNVHAGLFFCFLADWGKTQGGHVKAEAYELFHRYASLFKWPRRVGSSTGVASLSGKRAANNFKAEELKCNASEGRNLLPVLAYYCRKGIASSACAITRAHGECMIWQSGGFP